MAVTAVTTSAVPQLAGGISAYSYEKLEMMFLYGEAPCQVGIIEANATATWASNARETLLASPGAGKSLFVWGVQAFANNTGTVAGVIILQDGTGGTLPAITLALGAITILSVASPNAAPIVPIRKMVTAAAVVAGVNSSAGGALCQVRIYYCVI